MLRLLLVLIFFAAHVVNSLPLQNTNYSPLASGNELVLQNNEIIVRPDYYAVDPEAHMTIEQIIQYHGYPIEVHTVETADGYELMIHRIPYGKNGPGETRRKPVLIQHGLQCSSASWVSNPPDKNLPYLLVDRGYDVWLGNIRGTLYGRKHKKYKPEQKEFWAYSFDEMAKYDVPAMIDMMLNKTGFEQIYYIGHSMGTMMAFAMLSTQPKYNHVIKGMFALAPVATVAHVRSPVRYLAPFSREIGWILNVFGSGEVLANNRVLKLLSRTVCNSPLKLVCESVLFILCGFNPDQLNSTRLPVYLHHTPAASSVQNLVHIAQMVQSKKFQYHDFGIIKNKELYGQATPPEYNLKNIKTKVALFWSDNDYLADPNDVSWLATQIPSLILKYRIPDAKFSHLDFIWAKDINKLLHYKLISVMDKLWKN